MIVGSVFNGWDLLEPGFINLLSQHLKKFTVYRLEGSSAKGAAKFGAMKIGYDINLRSTKKLVLEYDAS